MMLKKLRFSLTQTHTKPMKEKLTQQCVVRSFIKTVII